MPPDIDIRIFCNPALSPALSIDETEGFWLGHCGQGVEDATRMSDAQLASFQHLIDTGRLQVKEVRYVLAAQQRLSVYTAKLSE